MDALMIDVSDIKVKYKSKYGIVGRLSEGLAVAQDLETGLWGYIDVEGNEKIPCQFHQAKDFHEGLAAVRCDARWGYVDKTGELKILCQYFDARDFSEGLAAVQTSYGWGYIDKNENQKITCKYESAYDFSDGLAVIKPISAYYAAIDQKGEIIVPYCSLLENYSEGLALASSPNGYVYFDREANIALKLRKYRRCSFFSEGMAAVQDVETDLWGFINRDGKRRISCKYAMVSNFSEGLAAVQDFETGLWGFIDKNGNLKIKCQYSYVSNFHGGFASVIEDSEDSESYMHGYIDKTGKLVIPFKYKRASDFVGELATVGDEEICSWAFLDKQGIEKPIGIPCYYRKINICGRVFELEAGTEKEIIEQTLELLSGLKAQIEFIIGKGTPKTKVKK